jgi:glucosamine-6-phosphate deaminase
MRLIVRPDYASVSTWAADFVARRISGSGHGPFVLGLPTGSTVLGLYERLRGLCRSGGLSFSKVLTFNMDEYLGLPADHPQSYRRFMRENLFSGVDIDPANVHIFDGEARDPERECADYEAAIAAAGGIDLFVGGVGSNGHLAFNEPGSSPSSRSRVIGLSKESRSANSRFFGGDPEAVPSKALTVGIGTVMEARELLILASGLAKARAVRHAVEEGVSQLWPVSALQTHPRCVLVCDEDASSELRVGTVRYFRELESSDRA